MVLGRHLNGDYIAAHREGDSSIGSGYASELDDFARLLYGSWKAETVVFATPAATWAVYDVVAEANVPKSIPLRTSLLRVASVDASDETRVTVTVYVRVVTPFSAVTSTVMTLLPTASETVPSESVTPPILMT